MKFETLKAMNAARRERHALILVTDIESGDERLVDPADIAEDHLAEPLADALRKGKSGMIEREGRKLFLTVHVPPVKLVMIGAVHISQALAPLARMLNYEPVVVDPRTAFATPDRFPGVEIVADWPDVALPPLNVDRYTAFVALTHDPKIDDPALDHALNRDCFYIGALGSRKTHAKRLERLKAAGFTEESLGRIRAPIGLDIGAISPAEIAVSIIAEITAALRLESGEKKAREA